MEHRIETNVEGKDIENVRLVLRRKMDASDLIKVTVFWPTGSNVTLIVKGNGAFLRDVAFALDVAGMLD
jgi:hypothetical protein